MPKTTAARVPRPRKRAPAAVAPAGAAAPAAERETRGARRKREMRLKLLRAALRLMAEKGAEGVAINEITEAADVGFGSFYNYFPSKEAIYDALVDEVFESFGAALDRIAERVSDPAEVLAASFRYTLLRARKDPLWGRFLVRTGFSTRVLGRGLGQHMLRDIQRGLASGRFKAEDLLMTFVAVGGTALAAIAAKLEVGSAHSPSAALVGKLGLQGENIPERGAAVLLRLLGVPPKEAEAVARRPLPDIELPSSAL